MYSVLGDDSLALHTVKFLEKIYFDMNYIISLSFI